MLILFILMNVYDARWISPATPMLPREDYRMAIGHYNNTIYLIGGFDYGYQLVEYSITNDIFIDDGTSALPQDTVQEAHFYTQLDDIVYMLISAKLNIFNLKTKEYTDYWNNLDVPIAAGRGCLASNYNYLFIVGGFDITTIQVLDLSTYGWSFAPDMNEARGWPSCIVDRTNNVLYAIGGGRVEGVDIYLKSIERLSLTNIQNNEWEFIDELTVPARQTRSVMYGNYIFVIGGEYNDGEWHWLDTVHIIYTLNGTVSLSNDLLAYPAHSVAAIVVTNTIYAFGGADIWLSGHYNTLDTWQYYQIPADLHDDKPLINTTMFVTTYNTSSTASIYPVITSASNYESVDQKGDTSDSMDTLSIALICSVGIIMLSVSIIIYLWQQNAKIRKKLNDRDGVSHNNELELAKTKMNRMHQNNDNVNEGIVDPKNNDGETQLLPNMLNRHEVIKEWFKKHVKLHESNDIYYNLFILNGYDDISLIGELNSDKLIKLGINKIGHRERILQAAGQFTVLH